MWHKFYWLIILFLVAWLSLLHQSLQQQYQNFLRLILFCTLIFTFSKNKSLKDTIISHEIFFWLFLGSLTLSYILAVNKEVALFHYWDFVITPILIYFLLKFLVKDNLFKWQFSKVICYFSLIVFIIGISEFIFQKNLIYEKFVFNPFYERYIYLRRIMSTQMHPAVLGTYFLVSFSLATFLFFCGRDFKERFLGGITGLADFLGVFLAFSHSAFWGMFIFLTFYLLRKNRKFYLTFIGILFLLFMSLIHLRKSSPFLTRFDPLFHKTVYQNQLNYRLERLSMAFKMAKEHPLVGIGINNFRFLFERYHSKKDFPYEYKIFEYYYLKKDVSGDVPYEFKIPDNMYLSIFSETGLIGSLCFLIFMGWLLRQALRALRTIVIKEDKEFLFVLICGFVGFLVNMASYDFFYWHMPLYFFWIYVGAIRGLSHKPPS